jgi:hypothetical protein
MAGRIPAAYSAWLVDVAHRVTGYGEVMGMYSGKLAVKDFAGAEPFKFESSRRFIKLMQVVEQKLADYETVLADHRRLVRELDVLLNGEAGAAKQASLCDIVAQVQQEKRNGKD